MDHGPVRRIGADPTPPAGYKTQGRVASLGWHLDHQGDYHAKGDQTQRNQKPIVSSHVRLTITRDFGSDGCKRAECITPQGKKNLDDASGIDSRGGDPARAFDICDGRTVAFRVGALCTLYLSAY